MAQQKFHPVIYHYLRKYQDDPSSRVFAPLAEAYRKAGLVDEALEIAREGIKIHPGFVGGKVALARALFDKKLYSEVVDLLTPIVLDVPDNLVAQRLLAESCLILGQVAESLSAYKMLLYFNSHDTEIASIVKELEEQAYEKGILVLKNDPVPLPQFSVKSANDAISDDPNVIRMKKIKKIELLQGMLQKVERYKAYVEIKG